MNNEEFIVEVSKLGIELTAEKLAKFARITFMKDDIEDVASEEYLQKTINQRCK